MQAARDKIRKPATRKGLTFQDLLLKLEQYWTSRDCILQQPYDVEVGAGTMHPETFLRVLGPKPYRVVYAQPSRRPADGRYGENPNRLYKHTQLQVILKPSPADIQDLYLESLAAVGINLKEHDIRFEEDNWESPTLGAWGIGWQVLLDGLEITQFTYFQQCGGVDLDPISVELTYGLDRIAAYLQDVDNVYDVTWSDTVSYRASAAGGRSSSFRPTALTMRTPSRRASSSIWSKRRPRGCSPSTQRSRAKKVRRFPILQAYDLCLKCSHLFNVLDARGAISVTERAGMIGRVRKLATQVARAWLDQRAMVEGGAIVASLAGVTG